VNQFLRGAAVMATVVIGMFFLRYWRATKDRLFLLFCVAFWCLGLNWTFAAIEGQPSTYAYVFRLLAFVIIAAAVLDKNRREARR
jgi:hypothetical protein